MNEVEEAPQTNDQQAISTPEMRTSAYPRLHQFMTHLWHAGMAMETILDYGYEVARLLYDEATMQAARPVDHLEEAERAAEMLATVSGELGIGLHRWLWLEQIEKEATRSGRTSIKELCQCQEILPCL